jgi:hypothetical protein
MKKLYALLLSLLILSPIAANAGLKAVVTNPGGVSSSGSFTAGDCVQFANTGSSGAQISDTGSACGAGGGGSPGGSVGQIQFKSSASAFGGFTMAGDCTLDYTTGNITCTKTSGNAFAASATTDTTNASNISSGTLPAGRLPAPTASTFGGVQSFASASNNFLTGLTTSGVFTSARPTCANLSDSSTGCTTTVGTLATLNTINNGNWSGTALAIGNGGTGQVTANAAFNALSPMTTGGDIVYGSVGGVATRLAANATATNKYLQSVSSGNPLWSQVSFSDLSGTATGAQLPAPTASTLGGVQSFASASNAFLTGLTTSGVLISAQPAFSNLSGSATCAQEPALTGDATTSAGSCATTVAKINGATLGTTTATSGNLLVAGGASWATTPMSGDATFLSTGAITIANSAVTNAKMANMANNTIKSNVSGGPAAPSDNTMTSLLDIIGSTQGDVLFRSASTWQRLAAGTSGQFLTTGGAAANPSWTTASGGGGMFNYSDNGLTLTANTYFAPIGGGGIPVTTEANVSVKSPSATTVTNLQVSLSVTPGAGQTFAATLRKDGVSQSLTCTISNPDTTCQDLTHSVTIAQNNLIDWQIVTTGTYVSTPTVNITANNGTSNVGVTSIATGNILRGGTITTTGTIDLNDPSRCDCRITLASGFPKYNPVPATAASVSSNIATFTNAHGWQTGTVVIPLTTAGGLTHDVAYFVNAGSTTTASFFTTLASALANSGPVALSAAPSQLTPAGIQGKMLYLDPSNTGGVISLYDGSANWKSYLISEISFDLTGISTTAPTDIFVYDNAGTPTMESAAWTSNNLRATALTAQNGVLVKSGSTTRRWVGTVYGTAANTVADVWYGNGTVTPQLYVMNAYNKIKRRAFTSPAYTNDNANTTFTTASTTWTTANGGVGHKVEFLSDQLNASNFSLSALLSNSGANTTRLAVGFDSTSDATFDMTASTAASQGVYGNSYSNFFSEGYHSANMLISVSAGTGTFSVDSRSAGNTFDFPITYIAAEIWE